MTVVYDAGVLVAADRSDAQGVGRPPNRLELGLVPVTTAPVVAQASRSPRQVQLRRFLNGCHVLPLLAESAHEIGALAGVSGTSDVVDSHLVLVAAAFATGGVLTSDEGDLRRLAADGSTPVPITAP